MSTYPEIGVEHRDEQQYVGFTGPVTMGDFAPVADRLPEIFNQLAGQGVAPAGPAFFRYRVIDMEREIQLEAGVPVPRPLGAPGDFQTDILPAGRYVTTTYTGPPESLVEVTRVLLEWAEDHGLTFEQHQSEAGDVWGCRLEFLETDPDQVPDPADWRTTLAFRLAD